MVKITHPSMGKGAGTSAPRQPQQDFIVDDASSIPNDPKTIEEHIRRFETQPEEKSEPITVEAPKPTNPNKTKLESLLFIGRLTKELELHGHKFELSTLTNREHNLMLKELYKFGDGADLFTIRILTLANALRSVDGVSLDDISVDGEFDNDYYRRMAVLDNMQLAIIEKLYDEYSAMVEEVEKLGNGEEIKK